MDFSIQNESGGTQQSTSELGSALDLRGLSLIFSSVENIPGVNARAAFTVNSAAVFREDCYITPSTFGNIKYMPWGADNQMPYDIIDLIERDETLATCQIFNAELCYGGGLRYALPPSIEVKDDGLKVKDTSSLEVNGYGLKGDADRNSNLSPLTIKQEVEDFQLDNDLASYFLGVCQDFKHFGFAVSVIILNNEGTKVVRLLRKEACYCRFAVAASRQRVDRLIGSLRDLRDEAIEQTLSLLPDVEDWVETPQAHFFATTLFPNIDLCSLCSHNSGRWEKYVELRSRAVGIELTLAEDYFSPELMSELRLLNLLGSLSAEQQRVVQAIRSQVVDVLQDSSTKSLCSAKNPINGNRMRDVVNFIRYSPGTFRLWHTSTTAKLFSPPKFENKKDSKGYFF